MSKKNATPENNIPNDPDFEVGEPLGEGATDGGPNPNYKPDPSQEVGHTYPDLSAYAPNPKVEPGEEVDPNRPIQGNEFVTHSELQKALEKDRFVVPMPVSQYMWASEFKENARALVRAGQSGVSDQTFALAERMTDKMLEFIDNKFKT